MEPRWSAPRRIAFRWAFAFGVLLVLPFPLDILPKSDWIDERYGQLWSILLHGIGDLIGIDVPPRIPMNGSGDTTEAYLQMAMLVVLAAIAAAVWSALDRTRLAYPRLLAASRVVLRYWLAIAMLSYGFAKVFVQQFPPPDIVRLEERVGDMSPMGMLWTFMGASAPYTIFGGLAECLGGVLLLWRRTTLVGSLVVMGVMTNVVMLNFCYDVPVKLYSSTLLVAAAVLAAPDARRLVACVFGRATPEALPAPARWSSPWLERVRLAGKLLGIAWVCFQNINMALASRAQYAAAPKTALYGAYDVEAFELAGAPAPRWQRMAIGTYAASIVTGAGNDLYFFQLGDGSQITLRHRSGDTATLTYKHEGDRLELDGTWHQARLHVVLHAREAHDYLLVTRGFHWINEVPFNR